MIYVRSLSRVNPEDYDEVWVIVRSWEEPDPAMRHVPELSPSWELLQRYLTLREQGAWNYEAFMTEYVPRFLREFRENAAVTDPLLTEICEISKAGKDICLACFCDDETICHRSIVAGFLQDKGMQVQTETGNDYRKLVKR